LQSLSANILFVLRNGEEPCSYTKQFQQQCKQFALRAGHRFDCAKSAWKRWCSFVKRYSSPKFSSVIRPDPNFGLVVRMRLLQH